VAGATQSVTLHATLTPERLGHGTTVGFGFDIAAPIGLVPPPLTELDVRYPRGVGIALSGLGIASCTADRLEAWGPEGCPANSFMGYGTALAEIQIGPEIIRESAEVIVFQAPVRNGRLAMLFYASGRTPVDASIVFPALLLPAPPPFGGLVHIDVPLVPSLPGAPDVAVVRVRSTIGPQHLTYYRRAHGKLVPYKPPGILLPDRCPRGGFPFAASFTFQDGSHASARTAVPCPRSRSRSGPSSENSVHSLRSRPKKK
jgi:hypothetical protein